MMTSLPHNLLSQRKLAHLLGAPSRVLHEIAENVARHYVPFDIRALDSETWRHIDNPQPRLKEIQRTIDREILRQVALPPQMFGGVIGGSIVKNASLHVGSPCVVSIDLRNCFGRINHKRVFGIFRDLFGCSTDNASLLTRLTTFQNGLPQGAPSSSTLANLALVPLCNALSQRAEECGLRFSMYVDDISVSGAGADDAIPGLLAIVHEHGHAVRSRKVEVMHANDRQVVTGLNVNSRVSVPREYRSDIAARIRHWHGRTQIPEHEAASLRGRIDFVTHAAPDQATLLRAMFERLLLLVPVVDGKKPRKHETRSCHGRSRHRRRSSSLAEAAA